MAISTCFGSPLLNDILGLGIALLITTSSTYPHQFHGNISNSLYIAWGFLAASLVSSVVVFHVYDYCPPREHAYLLFFIYGSFVVVSILGEAGLIY